MTALVNSDLPETIARYILFLVAAGFIPVLIIAWVYEMTPEGIKRERDVDRSQSVTHQTGRKINTMIIVLMLLTIAVVIGDRLVPETDTPTGTPVSVR